MQKRGSAPLKVAYRGVCFRDKKMVGIERFVKNTGRERSFFFFFFFREKKSSSPEKKKKKKDFWEKKKKRKDLKILEKS